MTRQLSEAVRQLIAKARIVSFVTWQSAYPAEAIAIFQAADDEGRFLSDTDLDQIQAFSDAFSSEAIATARLLREGAAEIVAEARAEVLIAFPGLTEPGGDLYPPLRAEACWRDFWHFLRCITYGIAGQQVQYTSAEGLHHMQLLYRELNVPLDAMVLGLDTLKVASLARLEGDRPDKVAPYFDRLREALDRFRPCPDAA
ncbi:hypothetical protein [Synechococcus sp. PCC 7336]|uniref:hypothetical protein n=1 Tax=Synechococcus sp. PCC 7336 TaxID=195250 RepID=UPI0003483115|nr:hypothetical protein [Synechococcus sp. PCC 7336]